MSYFRRCRVAGYNAFLSALISLLFPVELPNKEIWNLKVIKTVTAHVRFQFAITFVTHGGDE